MIYNTLYTGDGLAGEKCLSRLLDQKTVAIPAPMQAAAPLVEGGKTTVDDPLHPEDYVNRELTRLFIRLSEDPGDVHRVLRGLADAVNLLAMRVPVATHRKQRRLVWFEDPESRA